jgi:outer membrane lipoprotein-sorting protein
MVKKNHMRGFNMRNVRKVFFFLLTAVLLSSTACFKGRDGQKESEQSAYAKIQQTLVDLKSFRCTATVEYKANKGSNVYETIQHGKITGEYRVEVTGPEKVSGSVTCSDGNHIYQYSSKVNGRVSLLVRESQERSEIFLTSFVKNYLQSDKVSINVANMGEGQCTVLEAQIPGSHPYLATEKLWIDNTTFKPVKLIVYDPDGAERIIVTYGNFEYNVELDDSLFTV